MAKVLLYGFLIAITLYVTFSEFGVRGWREVIDKAREEEGKNG